MIATPYLKASASDRYGVASPGRIPPVILGLSLSGDRSSSTGNPACPLCPKTHWRDRRIISRAFAGLNSGPKQGILDADNVACHPAILMVFFVIEIKTRAIHIAGICVDLDADWAKQVERNLVDPLDGFPRNAKYLVHDRDPLFNRARSQFLANAGVSCVAIPAQSPNCNPYAERFVPTVREECLDQFVIFGEAHLRHLLAEFVQHHNFGRHHQSLDGKLIMPNLLAVNDNGAVTAIKTRSRLGGVLNFYHRVAA